MSDHPEYTESQKIAYRIGQLYKMHWVQLHAKPRIRAVKDASAEFEKAKAICNERSQVFQKHKKSLNIDNILQLDDQTMERAYDKMERSLGNDLGEFYACLTWASNLAGSSKEDQDAFQKGTRDTERKNNQDAEFKQACEQKILWEKTLSLYSLKLGDSDYKAFYKEKYLSGKMPSQRMTDFARIVRAEFPLLQFETPYEKRTRELATTTFSTARLPAPDDAAIIGAALNPKAYTAGKAAKA